MKMITQYIVKKNEPYKGQIQDYVENGIVGWSNGKTFEEWSKERPNESYLLLTQEEFNILDNKYLESLTGDWKEITEEKYMDMLEVLPPLKWVENSFYLCEAFTSNVHDFYIQIGDYYFSSMQKTSTPLDEIKASLNKWINQRGIK